MKAWILEIEEIERKGGGGVTRGKGRKKVQDGSSSLETVYIYIVQCAHVAPYVTSSPIPAKPFSEPAHSVLCVSLLERIHIILCNPYIIPT